MHVCGTIRYDRAGLKIMHLLDTRYYTDKWYDMLAFMISQTLKDKYCILYTFFNFHKHYNIIAYYDLWRLLVKYFIYINEHIITNWIIIKNVCIVYNWIIYLQRDYIY